MSSLLDSIAPPCSSSAFEDRDWGEECRYARNTCPALIFAGALALVGLGLVVAVTAFCTAGSVILCFLAGVI